MNDFWADINTADALRLSFAASNERISKIEEQLRKSDSATMKSIQDTMIVIIKKLEQKVAALQNVYGKGSLKVVYNTGNVFPYQL